MDKWDGLLLARLKEHLAANKKAVSFSCALMGGRGKVRRISGKNTLMLTGAAGPNEFPYPLPRLRHGDKASLARAIARDNHPEDFAIVAFYRFAARTFDLARDELSKAGKAGDEVRKLFDSLGDL